jgi:hypothetical protein
MNLSAAYGLLAHGLLFGALAALLPLGRFRNRVALAATTLSLLTGMAPIMLAVFGPPSVTLLALGVLQLAGLQPSPLTRWPALALLGTAAACLPPAPGWLAASCTLPATSRGLAGRPAAGRPCALLETPGAVAAHSGDRPAGLRRRPVANLWSALVDPLLVVLAVASRCAAGCCRLSRQGVADQAADVARLERLVADRRNAGPFDGGQAAHVLFAGHHQDGTSACQLWVRIYSVSSRPSISGML